MRPMRIAIIGYGKIAEDQHIPSIAGNPRFELAAVSSRLLTPWKNSFSGMCPRKIPLGSRSMLSIS